jgi:hypothetical protein
LRNVFDKRRRLDRLPGLKKTGDVLKAPPVF